MASSNPTASSSWKTECRKKSLLCVEELLETDITSAQLIQAATVLSSSQYGDVIDERNILGLCGYPLCQQKLGPVPTQQYRIIVQRKQILDITERKKYCSNLCYKCSQYFGSQLSPQPLWTRPPQTEQKKIQLLPHVLVKTSDMPPDDLQASGGGDQCLPSLHLSASHSASVTAPPTSSTAPPTSSSAGGTAPPTSDMNRVPDIGDSRCLSSFVKLSRALATWTTSFVTTSHVAGKSVDVYLPAVHSVTGKQIQWNIFRRQLNSALPKVCASLNVNLTYAQQKVTEYASHFQLDRHSITFKPPEWRIIILLLLIRCEFVSERVLHEDHPTISTWLADAQVNDLEVQELLSVLTEDIIKRKLITA